MSGTKPSIAISKEARSLTYASALAAPATEYPANEASIYESEVYLVWAEVSGADFYVVDWCYNQNFEGRTFSAAKVLSGASKTKAEVEALVDGLTVAAGTWFVQLVDPIPYEIPVYWRVIAYTNAGNVSDKSPTIFFQRASAAAAGAAGGQTDEKLIQIDRAWSIRPFVEPNDDAVVHITTKVQSGYSHVETRWEILSGQGALAWNDAWGADPGAALPSYKQDAHISFAHADNSLFVVEVTALAGTAPNEWVGTATADVPNNYKHTVHIVIFVEEGGVVALGDVKPGVRFVPGVKVKNNSGEEIPLGGMLKVTGHDSAYGITVGKPDADDLESPMVAKEVIAINDVGRAADVGESVYVKHAGAAPSEGDLIGTKSGQFEGEVSSVGSHRVRAVSGGAALAHPFSQNIIRIPVTAVAKVNDSTPDANDGSWVTGQTPTQLEQTLVHEERYAFKFQRQLPASVPISGLIQLGASGAVLLDSITGPAFQDQITISVDIKPIRDDFTPSTLTWNQLVALTKGTAQGLLGANAQDFKHPTIPGGGDLLSGSSDLTGSQVQGTPNNWDAAYGFEVLFRHTIPGIFTAWSLTTGPWVILNTRIFIEWVR